MVNERMRQYGAKRSCIREVFEYGKQRKADIGAQNVFDFSLGNPSVAPPQEVNDTLISLLKSTDATVLHGYTSAQGDRGVRQRIADEAKRRFGFDADADLIYLTCGAAGALTSTLTALLDENDEVIVPAPYFPEYRVFVERTGAVFVSVPCLDETFQLDVSAIESAITPKTKAVLINSPNNPTGAVYTEGTIAALGDLLEKKSAEYGTEIYLIADEPYRELVYGVSVPFVPNFYANAIVCYSFSKSLSLPGERIGYVLVSPACSEKTAVYQAVCGAGRALGFVCAPSLFQFLIPSCLGKTADLGVYDANRKRLVQALTECGYRVTKPDGAFYLFVQALEADAQAFCERAKKYELLLVPSDDFGCKGYVRISYCVSPDMIERSLSAFRALADDYKNK